MERPAVISRVMDSGLTKSQRVRAFKLSWQGYDVKINPTVSVL